ncbi:NAD(P)-dependent oxidoreductase [Cellulomonas sp. NPDC058312]|uniref:NAD(P)-dependent oxidoreductase n=1 Tax=Cellulomonas sp. NPDC058312 TaxID=3346441 RepID=UPI0036E1B884
MSLLMVGAELGSATEDQLDALALDPAAQDRLSRSLVRDGAARGVFVLSTCQRTEVYVEAPDGPHDAARVRDAWTTATDRAGAAVAAGHLLTRTGAEAAAHLFAVVGGRRSATVGESHVVDQVRCALARAQRQGRLGTELDRLVQQALRTGRRIRALDDAPPGAGLVQRALDLASARVPVGPGTGVLVVGAGTLGREAARAAAARGADVVVHNRTAARARTLADEVRGTAAVGPLGDALADADVVVCATSAPEPVVGLDAAAAAVRARGARQGRGARQRRDARGAGGAQVGTPAAAASAPAPGPAQVYVDLARPRDVPTGVGDLPGVLRLGLPDLADPGRPDPGAAEELALADARAWEAARRAATAGPTIQALRERAAAAVEDELRRVAHATATAGGADTAELLRRSLDRVVNRLLHAPVTRARAHAAAGTLPDYEALLADLFAAPAPAPAPDARHPRSTSEEVPAARPHAMR